MALSRYTAGNREKLPEGLTAGATRKGKILWHRVLTFQENGVLEKEEETSNVEWQEWNQR